MCFLHLCAVKFYQRDKKTKKHEKEDGISHSNIRIRSWTLLTPARSDPSHISPEIKEIKTPAKALALCDSCSDLQLV